MSATIFLCLPSIAAETIKISINGNVVNTDVDPVIVNSRTMVPVRVISETLGADVVWHQSTQTVVIAKDANVITLKYNARDYVLNGKTITADVAPIMKEQRILVPIRLISESFGAKVDWKNNTVIINTTIDNVDSQPTSNSASTSTSTSNEGTISADNSAAFVKVNQVDGNVVNLRAKPTVDSAKVGEIYSGNILEVLGTSNGWYKIKTASSEAAYVAGWLVSKYDSSSATPNTPTVSETSSTNNTPNAVVIENDTPALPEIALYKKTPGQGQSSIAFNIGNGVPNVISNNDNKIVVEVDGVQANNILGNTLGTLSPITGIYVVNKDKDTVQMTFTAVENGYFRLDINNGIFTVTGVAKHKNGSLGLAGKTIVVSPGHGVYGTNGAVDRGAISKINGLDEVTFNTPVAVKLRDLLQAAGAKVIMARSTTTPVNMSLIDRANLANYNNADAFVEIHGDSAANPDAYGIGTWMFDGSQRLTSSAQSDMRHEFASVMNQALSDVTGQPAYVKFGNFAVLRENEVPCVLIECGFLSNPEDAARLATPEYQNTLALAMFNGLKNYFAY